MPLNKHRDLEFVIATGKFRHLTSDHHPDLYRHERPRNNNCASKRDICINLLLAVRSLIVKMGLVAGDFNGRASRKDNARYLIEAAFGHTDIPWPDEAASIWGPGASWMMVCAMPLC